LKYQVTVGGRTFEIEITQDGHVWVDRQPLHVDFQSIDGLPQHSLLVDHRSYEAHVESDVDGECQVVVKGRPYQAQLHREQEPTVVQSEEKQPDGPVEVIVPLPGLLLELRVEQGQLVAQGDVIAVIDTMKMHLELRAPTTGVIIEASGDPMTELHQGEVLAVIEPCASPDAPSSANSNSSA
jgi:biotin carboxyl carrier protein